MHFSPGSHELTLAVRHTTVALFTPWERREEKRREEKRREEKRREEKRREEKRRGDKKDLQQSSSPTA
ncbi:hypothetical protein llap_17807 [Limosa lapponica baueri]|uniref:Uncharacterized protein n=1 Tax=Limosa lapponica baueri TaxID=1758121 RepID=A0A2I0TDJ5_LIMLA|nr:hypothetical protein llap_17807 [Limosa lapponica baueri]